MKLAAALIAIPAFAALAACEVSVDENIQEAAANQMEAIEGEAANLTAEAQAGAADVANTLENQAAALQDELDPNRQEAGNATAGNETEPANSQ